jgi:hypothetical protein
MMLGASPKRFLGSFGGVFGGGAACFLSPSSDAHDDTDIARAFSSLFIRFRLMISSLLSVDETPKRTILRKRIASSRLRFQI